MHFRYSLKNKARSAPEKSSREVFDEVITSTISQANSDYVDELVSSLPDFV